MKGKSHYNLRKNVLKELSESYHKLYKNYKYLKELDKNDVKIIGSALWILDNIYLIEKEYSVVKKEMNLEYFKGLPCDKKGSVRIFEFAKEYIVRRKNILYEEITAYLNSVQDYDEEIPFTMGEIWAFPLMLRCSLIISLEKYSDEIVHFQEKVLNKDKEKVDYESNVKKIVEGDRRVDNIKDAKVNDLKVDGDIKSWDSGEENSKNGGRCEDKSGKINSGESYKEKSYNSEEELEQYIGSYINSIRAIPNINWKKVFENTSRVEKILLNDPINIYRYMDFESKDYYRHTIEDIALVTGRSEIDVAINALELASEHMSDIKNKSDSCEKNKEGSQYAHYLDSYNDCQDDEGEEDDECEEDEIYENQYSEENYGKVKVDETSYMAKRQDYRNHIGYYIIDKGVHKLEGRYYTFHSIITKGGFVGLNIGGSILISALICYLAREMRLINSFSQLIISILIMINPINEIIISLTNWIVSKTVKIKVVPKMDYSKGIPYKYKTVVVIPSIVKSTERIKELMDKLETLYCGNKDDNVYFALLNDFEDSTHEYNEGDSELVDFGVRCAEKLNAKYCKGSKCSRFFFLNRRRIYNPKEKVYMGRERKRGKIMEFISLLRGGDNHTFDTVSSKINALRDVKYLITLDEDTFMKRETVSKLVGAMSHILNVPHVKNRKVIRGYGIMQPKISISLESKNKSHFSRIFAGENSVDGYSVAYSDTYMDLFSEGSFVGKGIIDIDEFYTLLEGAIKPNTILSHDLLEGSICRCALVTDVEFIDDYPSSYEASCKRLHRWTRGDWQLIFWLFSRKISLLNKWKILDNLRRSMLAPNLLVAMILALTILNNKNSLMLLCFLAIILPLVFTVTDFVVTPKNRLMGSFKTLKQILIIVTFIPNEAFLMADAIITTLFRVCISRRNLLKWKSSYASEKMCSNTLRRYIKKMWIAPIVSLLIVYFSLDDTLFIKTYTFVVAVLWFISPYIAYLISRNTEKREVPLTYEEKVYLRQLTRRIYSYYEDFVNEENNYLAPDNYQVRPFKGVAHRTSPTNIGMGLISFVTAYDLGYITMGEFINKSYKTLCSMNTLKKVHGHFLNWYDTRTKDPLWPRYVSTVDSGNLLANLWILKQTLYELKEAPVLRTKEIMSLKDIYRIIESENKNIKISFSESISLGEYTEVLDEIINKLNKNLSKKLKFDYKDNAEIMYWLNKLTNEAKGKKRYYDEMFYGLEKVYSKEFLEGVPTLYELLYRCKNYKHDFGDDFECTLNKKVDTIKGYLKKINSMIEEIDTITKEMDFKFLYDENKKLFSIGYNVEENSLGNSYYDLLASESRIASFVAISKNDINSEHWFKLSRAMTNAFHTHSLVSWSGTMFEYFMPSLVMRRYSDTLLNATYKNVIKAQIAFAKQKKIPWGISECAFYNFDNDENYQYKAFGVPGLGLKRGLEDEIVVSPYSTILALPFNRKKCMKNLKRLENINAIGRYGFIESIDYTKARQDKYVFKRYDYSYTQNVDKYVKSVDKYKKIVDKGMDNFDENMPVNNVDNVSNIVETNRNIANNAVLKIKKYEDSPQNDSKNQKNYAPKSYPQEDKEIFNDNIRPNRIITFMVHHLGMSLMALENTLLDNILINRFHSLPEVKASEILLKEKIPHYVTYERNEDYTIRNKYVEGKELETREFNNVITKTPQVLLLSNGKYSTMINNYGSGYSKLKDMYLYRWKGNPTSDDSGMFIYIKNVNTKKYWSAGYEPCRVFDSLYNVQFDLDKGKFTRKDGDIVTTMEVTLSVDEDFEIRKITLENLGDKGVSLEVTSYMEVVLATFTQDACHPAFSNLFVQTEYAAKERAIIGSRRGRVKNAKVPYIYHKIVTKYPLEGIVTYETSRLNFIGRNRTLQNPLVMEENKALENTVGTVLDPIISMRGCIRLEPKEKKEMYFVTGTSENLEDALEVCRYYDDTLRLDRLFDKSHNEVQLILKSLDLTSKEVNRFQSLATDILYLSSDRKNRESYVRNIKKYQKDLWAYGISGDYPIIFLFIDNEDDIKNVNEVLKFHYYLKMNNIKTDLIIYNDEELSYDSPVQNSLLNEINLSDESSELNKNAGIFLYNKSTMNKEIIDLLIGICRIYLKCNAKNILERKNDTNNNDDDDNTDNENLKDADLNEKDMEYRQNEKIRLYEESEEFNSSTKEHEINKQKLDFFNGYGGFERNDNLYVIKLSNYKNTPAPWINVISNENFGFHISESGSSYTWCKNSRENKITPWSNDYIRDPITECLYVKDDKLGKYFSITPKPVRDGGIYTIKHGFGYSKFTHTRYDIKGTLTAFVPKNEKVKLQIVSLENLKDTPREISLYYYAKLVLGVYEYDSARNITTYIERSSSQGAVVKKVNPHGKVDVQGEAYTDDNVNVQGVINSGDEVNLKNEVNFDGEANTKCKEDMQNESNAEENTKYVYEEYEDETAYIGGFNPYSEYFGSLHAYLTISNGNSLSFTGDNKEFLGNLGDVSSPESLNIHDKLSDRCGSIYDPILAAQTKIKLQPKEKREFVVIFGQDEKENIQKVITKYKNLTNVHKEFNNIKEYWKGFLGKIKVKTPSKSINNMLNGWLLYQTYSCRYLSRSAFYQSGGAYGYRDQLQDSMALGVTHSEIIKSQILRSSARQYLEGDVQHWYHPVINSGIRTRFSDDLLWLPYVTAEYIMSTGDYDILNKHAAYLEDEPLKEGEDERYTIVNTSKLQGTIYEHCIKAIEKSLKFGPHSIPLMGSGDWNDGMSTVGNKGKGESVWLGWFLYSILDRFITITHYMKDYAKEKRYSKYKDFIKENIENNAWDGAWYRRAYFDDGTPLGSRENPECQIDSLAQSWSIISEGARITFNNKGSEKENEEKLWKVRNREDDSRNRCAVSGSSVSQSTCSRTLREEDARGRGIKETSYSARAIEAMESVDTNLVKSDKNMILLLAPPFDKSYLEPGYIKGYVAGVRENGGQYTHAAVWVILALTKLGLGDKAVKYYEMINPINHTRTELECNTYKLEPYVMAADVYIKEPHVGRGGWSWYTGASGWMYKVGVENILGIKRIYDKGYEIKPCVPTSWDEYSVKIKNETEDYTITIMRKSTDELKKIKHNNDIKGEKDVLVFVDGKFERSGLIPRDKGKAEIQVYFN